MMMSRLGLLALSLGVVVALSASVRGEEPDTEVTLTSWQEEADFGMCQAGDCGGSACCCPVFEAGAEITLLRLHAGSLLIEDALEVTPEYDIQGAARIWIGRQRPNGVGWRVSWWDFEDSAGISFGDPLQGDLEISNSLDFFTVDLELTRQGNFCGWDLNSSIGVRIAGAGTDWRFSWDEDSALLSQDFTGAGLTFSVGTEQQIGQSSLSVYGGLRGSLLYGVNDVEFFLDEDYIGLPDIDVQASVYDQTVSVLEMQLGVKYERCTQMGVFFSRAGVEAQLWEMPPVVGGLGDSNVGLFGPTFALGLSR
jgi:YD repeat-containing protein